MPSLVVTTLADETAATTDLATETADGAGLSLREALAIANANADADTITFAPGLSGGTLTLLNGQLSISNSVTIDGDLDDDATPDITIDAAGASRVLAITRGTITLDGLTITNGNVTGSNSGGGISITGGAVAVTIQNSQITDNVAGQNGGGIFSSFSGSLTIEGSNIADNESGHWGGGLTARSGTLTINNSSFIGNSAVGNGGAIYSRAPNNTFTLSNSTIAQNSATGFGSGIIILDTPTEINNSTLTGNSRDGSGAGYQFYAAVASVSITDSILASAGSNSSSIRNSRSDITFSGTNVLSSGVATPHYNHSNIGSYTVESNISNIFAGTQTVNGVEGGALVVNGILSTAPINSAGPAANNAPVINIDNLTLAVTEGDSAVQIDGASTLVDADGDAEWTGGKLNIQITGNADAGDQISIADTDGDGIAITIVGTDIFANGVDVGDLSVSGGVVTGGNALVITFDADATNAIVAEVVQSIQYQTTSVDPGTLARTVTVRASDSLGANGSDTRTIAVTAVNSDPTISGLVEDITFTEDVAGNLDLSGSAFADVDSAGDITVTLTAGSGTMAATGGGGVVVTGTGTGTLTLVGTVAEINTFLDTASQVQYAGAANVNGNNATTVTITANDGDGSGDVAMGTVNIDITAVNDDPAISGLSSLVEDITFTEDVAGNLDLSGSAFVDVDSAGDITVTLTAGSGTMAATGGGGVVVTGTGTGTLTLVGTVAEINTFLDTASQVQYAGAANVNGNNATTVTITANDGDGSGDVAMGTVNIDITAVNDDPTGANATISGTEDTPYVFTASDFGFSDVDTGAALASVRIDIQTIGSGTLRLSGADVTDGDVITVADLDAGNLIYTPATDANGTGLLSFTFSVGDGTDFAASPSTLTVNIAAVADASDEVPDPINLTGNSGNDTLTGGSASDTLRGGDGDDVISGGSGDDQIWAGPGDEGADTISGGPGNDIAGGGGGDDFIEGDGGSDTLFGGSGNDTIYATSRDNENGDFSPNAAWGGAGDDQVFGGLGSDTLGGGLGSDDVDGGGGADIIFGGQGADSLSGGDDSDSLFGGGGNDSLLGENGNDVIFNGAGDDTVDGGTGNDTLWAGPGDDVFTGGDGVDTFIFGNTSGNDTITDFNAAEDMLDLEFASAGFSSLTEVVAAATGITQDGQSGVLIDLGDSDSVFIIGIGVADLTASNVIF